MTDYVTSGELAAKVEAAEAKLEAKIDKLPGRWEVRFLVLIGLMGAQFVPVAEVAQAAAQLF
jgi:hypothetical protein